VATDVHAARDGLRQRAHAAPAERGGLVVQPEGVEAASDGGIEVVEVLPTDDPLGKQSIGDVGSVDEAVGEGDGLAGGEADA
jgi:hypothetical protein